MTRHHGHRWRDDGLVLLYNRCLEEILRVVNSIWTLLCRDFGVLCEFELVIAKKLHEYVEYDRNEEDYDGYC